MSSFFKVFFEFFTRKFVKKRKSTVRARVVTWDDLDKILTVSILESRPRICRARIASLVEEEGLRFVILGFLRNDGEECEAFPWEKVLVLEEGE